jgi:hypothetical protein
VYDKKKDVLYCPAGDEMKCIGETTRTTSNGFKQKLTKYKAKNCKGCFLRDACHSQQGNRVVDINHRLRALKQRANEKLKSEKGIAYRKKRAADIEPVFGNLKHNKNFKRFMLKGLDKVAIETGLLAIAHNLAKMAA